MDPESAGLLQGEGYDTIASILYATDDELLRIHMFGQKRLAKARAALVEYKFASTKKVEFSPPTFCGGVAGLAANSYGASPGAQYLLSAFCGVMGDRLLSALLERFKNTPSSPTQHGGINNIGQTGIQGNQHCE